MLKMANLMGIPQDLELYILKMKLHEETKNYKAFIEDFVVSYDGYSVIDDYFDEKDYYCGYCAHQVTLTYKPRQVSVKLVLKTCNFEAPSKKTILDKLKKHTRLSTVGEWKCVKDKTGEWYFNSFHKLGDVSRAQLTSWNEDTNILHKLLGTRFDKFVSS